MKIKEKVLKDFSIQGFLEAVCEGNTTKKEERETFERLITKTLAEVGKAIDIDSLIGYVMNVRSDEPEKYAKSDLNYILKELKLMKQKLGIK